MDAAEKAAAMPTLRTLVIITIAGSAGAFILTLVGGFAHDLRIPVAILLGVALVCYWLLQKGMPLPTQIFLPTALFLGITFIATSAYGIHDESIIAYAFIIILVELTLGQRAVFIFSGLIIITVFAMGIAEITGILVSPTSGLTLPSSPVVIAIIIAATAFAQRTLSRLLNQSVVRARENEEKQKQVNSQLQQLQNELEARVAARTLELDEAHQRSERRASQFRAITEVSREITVTQNLQELLPKITELVSQLFGFYHVGIFMNDAIDQYTVLSAANSEGGKRMLARGHQLRIGEQGIVGFVTRTGEPRISLDVGSDAVYFNNPDLPLTRSEAAIPLKITGKIVGALDVQSTDPNAITPDDIELLTILADQISLVIQNARLFEQTQKSLHEAETVYRQYLRETWTRLPQEQKLAGFRFGGTGAVPLEEPADEKPVADEKSNGSHSKREVLVPIILRGERIGELSVQLPQHGRIKSDHMDLIRAVAERVALSIENARLFEETTRRAERERLVTDITTKIRGTNDPQDMIRTAVEELQRALGATRVEIIPQKSSLDPDK
jgi:GAF domain-containing protein